MLRAGMENCTVAVQLALQHIDGQLERGGGYAESIKKQFFGRTANLRSNFGFADALRFPFHDFQYTGVNGTITRFCTHMMKVKPSEKLSPKSMEDQRRVASFYSDRWADWGGLVELTNKYLSSNSYCEGPIPGDQEPRCDLDEVYHTSLAISWAWQYVSKALIHELGF